MRPLLPLLGAAILAGVPSCSGGSRDSAEGQLTQNKAIARRWIDEGFNGHNLAVVDELFALRPVINGQVIAREGIKQNMERHWGGFPDLHVTIDETLAEGQAVGIWYTVEGTHTGEFESIPPTGKRVRWIGFDRFRIADGKIVDARFLSDYHGLLTQLRGSVVQRDTLASSRP